MKKRIAILALLIAAGLNAATVYVTAHGKTYHTNRQCLALSRARSVLSTDDKTAEAHGLHICGICEHHKATGSTKKSTANDWAKPEGK